MAKEMSQKIGQSHRTRLSTVKVKLDKGCTKIM